MSTSSTSSNESSNETTTNRFAFQHFDQECDFGVENENGQTVRKRKKPGRKPNPPSVQERRAQNRAAQKAFREREHQRKLEKEKEFERYHEEIKALKKQLATVQYEAKYLKACVLHLTLSCLVHRGSVPHIWTESRIIPSNNHGEYKKPLFKPDDEYTKDEANQTPALLDMLLENNCIMDFDKALSATSENTSLSNYMKNNANASPEEILRSSFQKYIDQEVVTLNKKSQEPCRSFPNAKRKPKAVASVQSPTPSIESLDRHDLSLQHQPSPPLETSSSIHQGTSSDDFSSINSHSDREQTNIPPHNNQALIVQQKPIVGVISEPPSLKTSEDLKNMPPLQALHILKLQLKMGSILGPMTPAALLPTAIQRVIPHDIRIDFVPGASIRDRMIIFQDYYNIDECFQYLTQKSVFKGGDVRDSRNWVVDPKYSIQFWFISHLLVEQTYDDCFDKKRAEIVHKEYMSDEFDTDVNNGNNFENISAERSTASVRRSFANENPYVW